MAKLIKDDLDLQDVSTSSGSEEEKEELIFPYNVQESLAASTGTTKKDKRGLIISLWVVASLLIGWFLASWLRNVTSYYFLITLLVELALQFTVGGVILRFALDESTLINEMTSKDNSFARYFSIYRERISQEDSPYTFDVIEYADGSYGCFIRFLLGYNTNQVSNATYELNSNIQRLITKAGTPYRVIFMNERFSNSQSAANLRHVVSNIDDEHLFMAYRSIVQNILTIANEESNVLSMVLIINPKTQIQKEELQQLVNNITSFVSSIDSVYREVTVLSYQEIVEFFREYYKLEVLDMGAVRSHTVEKKSLNCGLSLLKLYGASGKTYTTDEYKQLYKEILKVNGLEPVNDYQKGRKRKGKLGVDY